MRLVCSSHSISNYNTLNVDSFVPRFAVLPTHAADWLSAPTFSRRGKLCFIIIPHVSTASVLYCFFIPNLNLQNNHQVTLVPLDKTHSLRETDYGYGNQNGISSSLPTTTHVSKPVGLKRRVTHSPGTPNLLEGLSREGSGSEPRSPSPHHTPKKSVVTDPKRTHTLSYPGESKMHSQGFPAVR